MSSSYIYVVVDGLPKNVAVYSRTAWSRGAGSAIVLAPRRRRI